MGVWIETEELWAGKEESRGSHPVWVCGLKQQKRAEKFAAVGVTPCMGVWIETLLASVI